MPTYEYECSNCGRTFELFQKITDLPIKKCPKCHKKVKRLIGSGAGIIFKGKGFYATDYRKPPKNEPKTSKNNSCPAKGNCHACEHG